MLCIILYNADFTISLNFIISHFFDLALIHSPTLSHLPTNPIQPWTGHKFLAYF